MRAFTQAARSQRVSAWARDQLPPSAVRRRTGLIFFFGVSFLVLTTVLVTGWINNLVNQDSQRVFLLQELIQQSTTWLQEAATPEDQDLHRFNSRLYLLLEGGLWVGAATEPQELPPETEAPISDLLSKALSNARVGEVPNASLLNDLSQAESLVALRRADNLGMARGLYSALLLSLTSFLLIGLWFTEEWVAKPVEELVQITTRIADGDLETPVRLSESSEFVGLALSLEEMRLELLDSRERLSSFASQMEQRVAQRTEELAALSQVVTAASRSMDLELVLSTALEQSLQVMDVETGGIWLLNEHGELHLAASRGMPDEMRSQLTIIHTGEGITGRAALSGDTIILEDVPQSPLRAQIIAKQEGLRSMAAVPFKINERVLGVLNIMTRHPRPFSAEEITLLNSISQQIGIGVENARLLEEIRLQTLHMAALQEREWISAELHDGLLQTLGYLYLQADQMESLSLSKDWPEMAEKLARQRYLLGQISIDIRRFIADLRTVTPPRMALETALQKMIDEFTQKTPVTVELNMVRPLQRLEVDHVAHLVRIAQEALVNATRHGHACRALVTCTAVDNQGLLSIEDDGRGFIPDRVQESSEHFGLSIMRARAARLGGQLTIRSHPGQGALVRVTWPLESSPVEPL